MPISEQNPFESEEQNPIDVGQTRTSSRLKNSLFWIFLVLTVAAALWHRGFEFDFSLEGFNRDKKELTQVHLPKFQPFHLMAFAVGDSASVWIFSLGRDSLVYRTVIDPLSGRIRSHGKFPWSNCLPPYPNKYDCLTSDFTVMNNKLWFAHRKGNVLQGFQALNGAEIVGPQQWKDRYGEKAEGFFNLNILHDGRCFFRNSKGESLGFYPFSEKLGTERSKALEGKLSGSLLRFFVDENPGKSDIYVTDAKQNQADGTIYFAWGYNSCQNYDRGFYKKEINRVWKLKRTLINPDIIAENGAVAIFLHQQTFDEQSKKYLEALDSKGNSLWKDSSALVAFVDKCKERPRKNNPHYKGQVAVAFHADSLFSVGIHFQTGKVLWQQDMTFYESKIDPIP